MHASLMRFHETLSVRFIGALVTLETFFPLMYSQMHRIISSIKSRIATLLTLPFPLVSPFYSWHVYIMFYFHMHHKLLFIDGGIFAMAALVCFFLVVFVVHFHVHPQTMFFK